MADYNNGFFDFLKKMDKMNGFYVRFFCFYKESIDEGCPVPDHQQFYWTIFIERAISIISCLDIT